MHVRNNSGFSLGEMMTVIAIMGVLAVIAIPNFLGPRADAKLRGAVRNLKSDLNLARLAAARESGSVNVEFYSDRYVIYLDADTSDTNNGGDKSIRTRALAAGVQIDTNNTTFPNNPAGDPRTTFNSRGLPESGRTGSVVLINHSGDTHTINLNRMGRMTP